MSTADETSLAKARGRRLKAARIHLGLKTAKAGSSHFKVKYDTYVQHERGGRDLTRDVAAAYADKLGVDERWLLWGKNGPNWAEPEPSASRDEPVDDMPNRLLAWREAAKMSVADLADKAGATQPMIQAWEAGSAELSDRWLRRFAEIFETTPGSILDVDPSVTDARLLSLWQGASAQQRQAARDLRELEGRAA